jgi:uncharacterized GH25 family protein
MKPRTRIHRIVAAVALILTAAGCAGLSESTAYRFEVVGQPMIANAGRTLTVRMVNASNGQPVMNAEVYALRVVNTLSPKAVPSTQWQRTALRPDGQGNYVYEGPGTGQTLRLTARVPGAGALIVGTVATRTPNPG